MEIKKKERLGSKKLKEVFEHADSFAAVAIAVQEKYGCLLIPEEKWDAVTEALHEEVGAIGWKPEWDY